MSNQVSEPGWDAPAETPPPPPASPPAKRTGRRGANQNQSPDSPPSPSQPASPTTPDSSSSETEEQRRQRRERDLAASRVLTDIISSVINGASSLVSIYTTRRFNLPTQIQETESKAIARPVARLIQRRAKIRRDLDDAADGAGALAGFMNYIERVAAGSPASAPPPRSFPAPAPAPRVADETEPGPPRAAQRMGEQQNKNAEGGAFKETFLSGFDEVR